VLQMLILKVSDFFNLLGLPREFSLMLLYVVLILHLGLSCFPFLVLFFDLFFGSRRLQGGLVSCGFGEEVGVLDQVVYLIGFFFFLVLAGAFLGFSFLVLAWAFPLWRFNFFMGFFLHCLFWASFFLVGLLSFL